MTWIETKRLRLRNVTEKDADVMYDYRNNELCARYQRGQTKDYNGILALTARRQGDVLSADAPCLLAAALKDTDEMVGEIVVMPSDGVISLGYTVSYKHHRKGYAFEALTALIEWLHARWPEKEFICFTEPENEASMALLKKLGFRDMGYIETKTSQVFGKWTSPSTEADIARAINHCPRNKPAGVKEAGLLQKTGEACRLNIDIVSKWCYSKRRDTRRTLPRRKARNAA